MPSGDIKVTGVEPHDYSILRQEWPDTHGKITPVLPQEKSINQSVLILDLAQSIAEEDIKEALFESDLHPKDIRRFNKKGAQEKSTTVMVTFASKEQKDKILANGFRMYGVFSFRVVDFKEDPTVIQCFRCQAFGHHFHECQEEKQKCLRCSGDNRVSVCDASRSNPCCANCSRVTLHYIEDAKPTKMQ